MSKVTVVGAGAVGATCANVMACREVASEVVLIDIKEGLSEGKMLDMYQCSTLMDFDTKLVGVTNDYKQTANSDVVVITSGIPRKPGMTREELIGTNANIMKGVIENVVKYSPRAIIIVVANPMDTLTYLALKASGLPKNRIIGMGGALDSARFKCYLAKATGANINNVDGMVIGGHGDTTMIPLLSKASVNGVPVTQFASKKKLEEAVASTMVGGATLTKLIGTSAWYAPGAAASMMVESILHDQKKIVPCCCYLEGEYGQNDICIGVPAVIGRKGIEKIVKLDLTKEEAAKFFPVYFELQEKKKKLNDESWSLMRQGKDDKTTEAQYEEIVAKVCDNRIAADRLDKSYLDRFKKILSNKKIYLVQRAEMRFHREMLKGMNRNDGGNDPKRKK